jgi:type II secretory pathway pseudopilin PulG
MMSSMSWHNHRLTLNEILCSIAVLLGLAFVVLPFSRREVEARRVTRTVADLRALEVAVMQFKADTGRFPVHYADYDAQVYPDLKNLTVEPRVESGITAWAGPYLDAATRENAWGGLVHLHYATTQFDLDGDGATDTAGENSFVVLTGVPSPAVARLDVEIDGTASQRAGRLQAAGAEGGRKTVYFLIAD